MMPEECDLMFDGGRGHRRWRKKDRINNYEIEEINMDMTYVN